MRLVAEGFSRHSVSRKFVGHFVVLIVLGHIVWYFTFELGVTITFGLGDFGLLLAFCGAIATTCYLMRRWLDEVVGFASDHAYYCAASLMGMCFFETITMGLMFSPVSPVAFYSALLILISLIYLFRWFTEGPAEHKERLLRH